MRELGYELDRDELNAAFARFKEIADRRGACRAWTWRRWSPTRCASRAATGSAWTSCAVSTHSSEVPTAHVAVTDADGAHRQGSGTGDGPVNALMHAIDAAIGSTGVLLEYQVSAVTSGTDALGEARVVCEIDGRNYSGQGVSTDVLEATAVAYLRAVDASRRAGHGERVMAGGV